MSVPAPDLVKPPVPIMAPVSVVVLAATEKIFPALVKVIGFARLMVADVFNCAVPLVLFNVSVLSFSKLASVLKSNIAVPEDGVTDIAPPVAVVPNACVVEAINLPAVIVVVPV